MTRVWTWRFLGASLILLCSGWTLLSSDFTYGEGHLERPIIAFLVLYAAAWVVYVAAVILLQRNGRPLSLSLILGVALLSRLVLLPSNLIQENDVYRYVLDGQVLLHGENPYLYSPKDVPSHAAEELRVELLRPEAALVLSRIGYPEIPTVYPPVAQVCFALGAIVGDWDWRGQRGIFLVFDLLTILLLLRILASLNLPRGFLLLYGWNPLILKEITNSVHLDILVGLFLGLTLLALIRFDQSGNRRWLYLAGASIGCAAGSKLYPLILLPATVWWLRRRSKPTGALTFAAIAVGVLFFLYTPFLSIGLNRLSAGLQIYAETWRMNEGLFSVFRLLEVPPRFVSGLILSAVSVVLPLLRRDRDGIDLAETFAWILLTWFLLIPTPFPWYATPLVALLSIAGRRSIAVPVVLLSGLVGLYYLSFYFEYHSYPSSWWTLTRAVEHSLIWLGVIFAFLVVRRHGPKPRGREVPS